MIVSETSNRVHSPRLMACVLLCAMVLLPVGVTYAQGVQAVGERLAAAGEKFRSAADAGKFNSAEKGLAALAKWHQIKEKIITSAVAKGEISEEEAGILRLEIVKAEAAEMAKALAGTSHFEQIDTNGDGFIDLKEAKVMADYATSQQAASVKPITGEQMLAFMDTNRDGKISKDEWAAMVTFQTKSQQAGTTERKAAEMIVRSMDGNRDGKISKDEISAVMKPYFEQIDTNGDGFIDAKEAWGLAYYANSQQVKGPVTAEQIVGYLDKNGDGKISKDEASAELKPHFEQIDTNKDGVIDVKEAQVMADYVNSQQAGSIGPAPEGE
jgi:Ca2+-binding EF-hand superfamily protein